MDYTIIRENGEKEIIFVAENIPSFGYKLFEIRKRSGYKDGGKSTKIREKYNSFDNKIENDYFRLEFSEGGCLSSIYDKVAGRNLLKKGEKGNLLEIYYDKPKKYDAWNIDKEHLNHRYIIDNLVSMKLVEDNSVRKVVEVIKTYNNSTIKQNIMIYNKIPRIDFETVVDWHETHRLLKTCFPVDIHTNTATYEIGYGNIERSNNNNTSWEQAQYEVCGHKWADLSEPNYGISILNDCKYGYSIKNSDIRLTLLKSAVFPDPEADRGINTFTYSLYPHEHDFRKGGTAKQAYSLNVPLIAKIVEPHDGRLPKTYSFFSINKDNVIIEVVKYGEDGTGLILRLYEYFGQRDRVELQTGFHIANTYECNMLEENERELETYNNTVRFDISSYEIKTLRLVLE